MSRTGFFQVRQFPPTSQKKPKKKTQKQSEFCVCTVPCDGLVSYTGIPTLSVPLIGLASIERANK